MENKKGLIIVIAVLGLLTVGLGGFLVYDKVLSDTKDCLTADKKDSDNTNITLEEAEIIATAAIAIEKYDFFTLTEIEDKVDNLNSLDNQFKLELGLGWAMNNGYSYDEASIVDGEIGYTYWAWADGIEEYFAQAFGPKITYKNEGTFYCFDDNGKVDHFHYEYDKVKDAYYDNDNGHGGWGAIVIYQDLIDFTIKDGKYSLTYNLAFTAAGESGLNGKVYNRHSYAFDSDESNILFVVPESLLEEEDYEGIYDYMDTELKKGTHKLNEYTFTFADVDGELKLVAYEFKEAK